MGMYAVMYRLRRVRFFYQLFFYFNYVTAPALILLPAWIANEVLQHFFSGQSAGYMAHLGGLLTGATLMALHLRRKPRAALAGCHSAPDRKSTRLNSSHSQISYAVFCLKKKKTTNIH